MDRAETIWDWRFGLSFVLIVGLLATVVFNIGREPGPNPGSALVVYCAHDAVYSDQILREFEKQTGIDVEVRFDTEATKSLGLVELIARERSRPRCDVFWNNEQLGTMWLAGQGLLEDYKGEGHARIPAAFKDADGLWTGFAGRMRVWIINTEKMEATPQAIESVLASPDLSRMAIAKPLYGTTRTHYTVLWDFWGPERTKGWHHDWRERGVIEASGNAMVKNLVAAGTCHLGLTDTDDFFLAKDDGRPVAMLPAIVQEAGVRSESDLSPQGPSLKPSSIVIPNTVAIIRGTPRIEKARRLVDFLLSAETELALANSKSRQIPLGPVDAGALSDDVKQLVEWAERPYPLSGLGRASVECLEWLRSEYLR